MLQVVTSQGSKPLPVKVDSDINVNTIPPSQYHKQFTKHLTKASTLKKTTLQPTTHTWSSHNVTVQQIWGFFMIEIQHKILPKTLKVCFYIFEDTRNLKILLSYTTFKRWGIIELRFWMKPQHQPWMPSQPSTNHPNMYHSANSSTLMLPNNH